MTETEIALMRSRIAELEAIARHSDVNLPLILTEGLRQKTSKSAEWVVLDCEVRSHPDHPRRISREVRYEKDLPSVQRKVSQNNFIFARIASGGRINEIKCLY